MQKSVVSTIAEISTTLLCCITDPPKCRGHWTEWFDSDNPSREGDHELISNLLRRHPGKLCYQPIAIDARLAETEIGYDHALPNVEIDTEIGFKCNNEEGRQCPNYEVRFCCQEGNRSCDVHYSSCDVTFTKVLTIP